MKGPLKELHDWYYSHGFRDVASNITDFVKESGKSVAKLLSEVKPLQIVDMPLVNKKGHRYIGKVYKR